MNKNDIKSRLRDIVGPIIWSQLRMFAGKNEDRDNQLTYRILKKVLSADSNCIDVGCAFGSILEAMIFYAPRGTFLAFEPIPVSFERLVSKFGDDRRVQLLNLALSNRSDICSFNYVITNPGYSGLLKREYDSPNEKDTEIQVTTKKLDDIVPRETKIDLIKIDVEGAEFLVFEGAMETIKRNKPTIIFECGLGAADKYGTNPGAVFDLLSEECGLQISLLTSFLQNGKPMDREEFCTQFNNRLNYMFVAHNIR